MHWVRGEREVDTEYKIATLGIFVVMEMVCILSVSILLLKLKFCKILPLGKLGKVYMASLSIISYKCM